MKWTYNLCAICSFIIIHAAEAAVSTVKDVKEPPLRVCVVEGRGNYKKTKQYCPDLEKNSHIECVIGLDRLDCLRRIDKNTADFGVFYAEDLVAARWSGVEILVASEMRFHDKPFEYEIVAIVADDAGINSAQDLRGAQLCHPGYGLQNEWTEVLANYFEASIVPRLCEDDLTLAESKLKASASFFGPSCKAGPWVLDPVLDRKLKMKYPSLCQNCDRPYECGMRDKHWGRRGPLYCLTSGHGNVAWARLDDTKTVFGFYPGLPAESDPLGYSFLCPDGHLQPLSTPSPCIWVAKPWPVIAAQRTKAAKIQTLVDHISHDKDAWENALLHLLETYHVNVTSLDQTIPIDNYLDQAVNFQSAYSFASCNPPRSIVYCTTSIIELNKCSWLQETASASGIEPSLQCIRVESPQQCYKDIQHKAADVMMVDHDHRIEAERHYEMSPILFEYAKEMHNRYTTVAVVKSRSRIRTMQDLRGKIACLPNFEGAAYMSTLQTLRDLSQISTTCPSAMWSYFSHDSCAWLPNGRSHCDDKYRGDLGALRCLAEMGEVAFISVEAFNLFYAGNLNASWARDVPRDNFRMICPYGDTVKEDCFMHWTTRGQIMVSKHVTEIRRDEIYNSLKNMDNLFGKHFTSQTVPFTMYGSFNKMNNVLFRDSTDSLKGYIDLKKVKTPRLLEDTYREYISNNSCVAPLFSKASSEIFASSFQILLLLIGISFFVNF